MNKDDNKNIIETFNRSELMMLSHLALENVNIYRENSDCIDLLRKIRRIIKQHTEAQ